MATIVMSSDVQSAPVGTRSSALKAVSGFWYTQDRDGGIQLYPCGDRVCGRFFWIQKKEDNGGISRDTKNPNPQDRNRPLCHMQFMGNFAPEEEGHYTDGWIYSPRDGGTYSAEMTLVSHDKLELRGYLFVPLLGESQTWTRANSLPDCAQSDQ